MRYVAFLRAINVGGRVVRMDGLRRLFTSMGHSGVETFIASGNVIFESPARSAARLEAAIEPALQQALGYSVATFVRSAAEIDALAQHPLVSGAAVPDGVSVYVAFTRAAPAPEAVRKLMSYQDAVNDFEVRGRDVLCMLRGPFAGSTFSGALLEKTLAMPATLRNATTVRRLAAKYGAPASGRPRWNAVK